MIVREIMRYLWNDKYTEFNELLNELRNMSAVELFEMARKNRMTLYKYPATNMNLLSCSICSYRLNAGFAGCSMCNYENEKIMQSAIMRALYEKNKVLYSKAVVQSFVNVRGIRAHPEIFELISSYDVFSDEEFPEELLYEIFINNDLYSNPPMFFIFEVRASNITKEKLNILKKYIPNTKRVIIEFGVEVKDDWVRNHWLNKGVNNKKISESINYIHAAGYKATADVLIGIPGFTEEQSIKCFCDTVTWLDEIDIDHMVVLPLNRKHNTMQGALYEYLRNDTILNEKGIVQGEHTGTPWLTTVVRALYDVIENNIGIVNKLGMAQLHSYQNSVTNITAYNSEKCICNNILIATLDKFQKQKDERYIREAYLYAMSGNHGCVYDYEVLLEKQKNIDIVEVTTSIIESLCKCFWPKEAKKKLSCFEKELALLKGKINE